MITTPSELIDYPSLHDLAQLKDISTISEYVIKFRNNNSYLFADIDVAKDSVYVLSVYYASTINPLQVSFQLKDAKEVVKGIKNGTINKDNVSIITTSLSGLNNCSAYRVGAKKKLHSFNFELNKNFC